MAAVTASIDKPVGPAMAAWLTSTNPSGAAWAHRKMNTSCSSGFPYRLPVHRLSKILPYTRPSLAFDGGKRQPLDDTDIRDPQEDVYPEVPPSGSHHFL